MTQRSACSGSISSLKSEIVLFTGKLHVNGKPLVRTKASILVRRMGVADVVTDESRRVTLIISGEQWTGPIEDPRRRYSGKLVKLEEWSRTTGRHVHVIDEAGFSQLCRGLSAKCHPMRPPTEGPASRL
ncbi:MAG: hypothetical protein ACTMIR_01365 [Cellulomonadaceae bacterium]